MIRRAVFLLAATFCWLVFVVEAEVRLVLSLGAYLLTGGPIFRYMDPDVFWSIEAARATRAWLGRRAA